MTNKTGNEGLEKQKQTRDHRPRRTTCYNVPLQVSRQVSSYRPTSLSSISAFITVTRKMRGEHDGTNRNMTAEASDGQQHIQTTKIKSNDRAKQQK